jgi:hypothetical protein
MEISALHIVDPIRLDTAENLTFISSVAHSRKEYQDLEIKAISGSLLTLPIPPISLCAARCTSLENLTLYLMPHIRVKNIKIG